MSAPRYRMQLSLNVLEHLGINLYSNVPSVLSEVVANAWDADATKVDVEFDKHAGTVIIEDDGVGMTPEEVNERFLKVGYSRRQNQPGPTARGRAPMGRKGIGKLSLFSVAGTIQVHTVRDGTTSAFEMSLKAMREAIQDGDTLYEPKPIEPDIDAPHGTKIVLSDLKRKQTLATVGGLRKRLARRFSIIGGSSDFEITVNGGEVTPEDRGYYGKVQYLWTYGDQSFVEKLCTNVENIDDRTQSVRGAPLEMKGWLGTVRESGDLRDDGTEENLNRIAIFVRGKMAQEDLLADFTERGVYASYLIGELSVDGLDEDGDEDAATSSRQKIVEDDPRYVALKGSIAKELKYVQNRWSELRTETGAQQALAIPAVDEWVGMLPKELKAPAKRWLGKAYKIKVDDPAHRKQLVKQSVLAFEFYRWSSNLDKLETVTENDVSSVVSILSELDGLEANLYGQIVQQRVEVIRALQEKTEGNALERIIQEYIFDHLWLLDTSWERVEGSPIMEKRVDQLFEQLEGKLSDEEAAGRVDIQYRHSAGQHIVIELKRPSVTTSVYDLSKQIGKYRSGIRKILDAAGKRSEQITFVCLLGKPPSEWAEPDGQDTVNDTLAVQGGKFLLYDELLTNTYDAYKDYTEKRQDVDRLSKVIASIDDYGG